MPSTRALPITCPNMLPVIRPGFANRWKALAAAAISFSLSTPVQAAVDISATPIGPASFVFEGLTGYGGAPSARASLPVRITYFGYEPGGFNVSGIGVSGLLDVSFAVSATAPRNYYPFVDPFVKQSGAREGASWSGNFDSMTVRLTIPTAGDPLLLLALTSTTPDTRFTLDDFVTYQTNGRGLKLEQVFGGSERHGGRIQAGTCHSSFCSLPGPETFTLESDILQLGSTIRPGSFKGLVMILGDPDAGFTAGPDTDFTAPFQFLSFTSAVPEPGSWAMMILGFGGIGMAVRRRARAPITAD